MIIAATWLLSLSLKPKPIISATTNPMTAAQNLREVSFCFQLI